MALGTQMDGTWYTNGWHLPRISLDPILSRLCVVSLIYAYKMLNHRTTRSRSASTPRTPSLSKPKVNWLLHISLTWLYNK